MNGYIKERANIQRNQSKKPIVALIILFFAVVFLRPAHSDYAIVYVIISLLLLTAAAYLIIFKYLVWYSYQLTENELVFIKNIGSHDKYLMVAPLSSIVKIEKNNVSENKTINYPLGDELFGSFDYAGKIRTFSFSPSDEMKRELKNALGDRFIN